MLTTCRSGNTEAIDTLLVLIETGREERREARKEKPFTKATNLKWAAPSPLSTVGTLIFSALASTVDNLTNKTRNVCNALNAPQRHNAAAIIDGLEDTLQWESVQNVKRLRKVPVHRDEIAAIVCKAIDDGVQSPPVRPAKPSDVSTLGTQIIEAIQTAAGYRINCGQCKSYLNSLNKTLDPVDAATIVRKIIGGIGLPARIREEVGGTKEQRVWLMSIIERVINAE